MYFLEEFSSCGVGLIVSLKNERCNDTLKRALLALHRVEHRGGVGSDGVVGDGSGILTSIPFELFGKEPGTIAVATIFMPQDVVEKDRSLIIFEETFSHFGLEVLEYRDVPIDKSVLSPIALENMPKIKHVIFGRPIHCRTLASFEKLLYLAKQMTRTKMKEGGIVKQFFFASLSCRTIVYKALCTGITLPELYLDLKNPKFETSFAIFHRRFSTNTKTSWDKVQPFRLIAHNGEINTIEGNKAWAITREKAIGLRQDELITHTGTSDSGNLNGMVEALKYRSSIPQIGEILSIMIPPASVENSFYRFWSRGMEPWDGPALVAFCDGKFIGARLDRNGFRPCRWQKSSKYFYLCSEAGVFDVNEKNIIQKGALLAGQNVTINALSSKIYFNDPSQSEDNKGVYFDPHLIEVPYIGSDNKNILLTKDQLNYKMNLFGYSKEDLDKVIIPMVLNKSSPIGSMGDTARIAVLSELDRPIFDYFYQSFAQVTNPALDYIREKSVTSLKVYLGRKPNIFEPKEFIPPKVSLELPGPIISLGQMDRIKGFADTEGQSSLKVKVIDITIPIGSNEKQTWDYFESITETANNAIKSGASIIILNDRKVSESRIALPSLLALRAVNKGINKLGRRLRTSIILEVGDVRNGHQAAVCLAFGATAICPYLLLEVGRNYPVKGLELIFGDRKEKDLISVIEKDILRIMAKMGISVLRSYCGSELFTAIGISNKIMNNFFGNHKKLIGGKCLMHFTSHFKLRIQRIGEDKLDHTFFYKEHPGNKLGERHLATSKRSRIIHALVNSKDLKEQSEKFDSFKENYVDSALSLRSLFSLDTTKRESSFVDLDEIDSILSTFGSGAMSFGSISAEAQRDIIEAFKEIGGRSNSGEGGENPYFYQTGITASVKQIASGRFGVTAEYLVSGDEVQIKISQGAKPGEGGQLMGKKVSADIARARYSAVGVDLISPPPQHDIYSIEDLKQLIYELKELNSNLDVSVKLVSGKNIGPIAVGVVKAGADTIQISGGDGGTGAASLLSMKHAGLPLEFGLFEVHKALHNNGLRGQVKLRVDGNLQVCSDIIKCAILGADQFDFGKILLIAEGCIMARVCEKNTCPAGIATQNPKFKKFYKGSSEKVVTYLKVLARDIRKGLNTLGVESLSDIIGRFDLLNENQKCTSLIKNHGIDLSMFTVAPLLGGYQSGGGAHDLSRIGAELLNLNANKTDQPIGVVSTDRAVMATLVGKLAYERFKAKQTGSTATENEYDLTFHGSAGQGFAVFNVEGVNSKLFGEANDSVAKAMSGGKVVIVPREESTFLSSENSIIGNCALYGATGGKLFCCGQAGDRFAVRNSGAISVVEGVGLHGCEYMTGGCVIVLGKIMGNLGAGMTGGIVYVKKSFIEGNINFDYLRAVPLVSEDLAFLKELLMDYLNSTGSQLAAKILDDFQHMIFEYQKFIPNGR